MREFEEDEEEKEEEADDDDENVCFSVVFVYSIVQLDTLPCIGTLRGHRRIEEWFKY